MIIIIPLVILAVFGIDHLGERYMKGNHLTYEATKILDELWTVFLRDCSRRYWWDKESKIMRSVKPQIVEFALRHAMDELENKKEKKCINIWMQETANSINYNFFDKKIGES